MEPGRGRGEIPEHARHEITLLLQQLGDGNQDAVDRLLPLVYDQLHGLAHRQRLRWHGAETLNTTALVNEAYLRLVQGAEIKVESRVHFLRIAAKMMRYIVLDYAKAKKRQKRPDSRKRVPFDDALAITDEEADYLLDLDMALQRLEAFNKEWSQIVECRFFADMTIDDTAAALGLSPATIKRRWNLARAWLYREMNQ